MPGTDMTFPGLDSFGVPDEEPVLTVTQLTAVVRSAVESAHGLSNVAVAGEISACTRSAKGHIYITLKDGTDVLSVVAFARTAAQLSHQPRINEQVVCYGSVSVYGGQGRYQLYCTDITLQGEGTQAAALEALRKRLEQEGLFNQHRPVPAMPKTIAVVTSPTGAAITDIKNVLARRCPMVKMLLIPALVQGAGADFSVAEGIRRAQSTNADVIIFGRGGGSAEDLSCFNSEVIARAVYASRIPTISAVGHERDYSICDYAADLRAPTPSAAVELATSKTSEMLCDELDDRLALISTNLRHILRDRGNRLDSRMSLITALSPAARLRTALQRLETVEKQIKGSVHARLDTLDRAVTARAGVISALNPLAVLSRGYSVTSSGGRIISDAQQLTPGDSINVRLGSGEITATVTSVSSDQNG